MIHHLSIPAHDPLQVARVLARFWQSEALPFPMYANSYIVFSDADGVSAIEVYPAHRVLQPSTPELPALVEGVTPGLSPFHAALAVPVDEHTIHETCSHHGWQCHTGHRGSFFRVVEVWVENHTLLELLPPEMAAEYRAFSSPANWKSIFGTLPESLS